MNTLVAEIAVAVVPNPVPVVMEAPPHKRLFGCGAAPQIVVHARRNRLRLADLADTAAWLVAQSARHVELAEFAGLHKLDSLPDACRAAALGSGLANAVVLTGRLDDSPPFADVMADRFLDVGVLTV